MTTYVEQIANLVIGTVEAVSPAEIRVLLELDAPHTTALNAGSPGPFPRLHGYVLIPNELGATVAHISWIGIERSPYPKRTGLKDFGLVDLPYPLRKMALTPVGTLVSRAVFGEGGPQYELARGVAAFPSIGDQVLLPSVNQIRAIVGEGDPSRRLRIGASPMAGDADVSVDPDKLFGRHLAVLGNTGSGKSCTVAGLIRWSLDAAKATRVSASIPGEVNARFIVLDPNGEYATAFSDIEGGVRVFQVPPVSPPARSLQVPAWSWNGHEWCAITHAQPGVQRPLLLQGLRELKCGHAEALPRATTVRRYLWSYRVRVLSFLASGVTAFQGAHQARFLCAGVFQRLYEDCTCWQDEADLDDDLRTSIRKLGELCAEILAARQSGKFFNDFACSDLERTRDLLDELLDENPEAAPNLSMTEDAPIPFDISLLPDHLQGIATEQGGSVATFISTLTLRLRTMLAEPRLASVIAGGEISFSQWLNDYIGADQAANGPLAIIDLSLVPSEIIHVVVAVLGRVIFEALQRYRRTSVDGESLPTVLVLEEAHTFIRKGRDEDTSTPLHLCRETFERIAREGRKFGLGLVLSSQRPSELSATVLAQCNTFLLHRIVNDADQTLLSRLVPDNLGSLLKELPSLPSRHAILLGWATPVPVLVEIDELARDQRPQSADPDFWKVWTGEIERRIDWQRVANEWATVAGGGNDE